ncbi:MAG: NADH-quinone oxidoreductase subunit H [Candidatus Heimdallarchaeota archaeon]
MADLWFYILIYPGFTFMLVLTLLMEQITSRVFSRFKYASLKSPMFIPLVNHLKLVFRREKQKITGSSIIQSILLFVLVSIPLFGMLFLPVHIFGDFVSPSGGYGGYSTKTEGIISILSFEGDVLLLMSLMIVFSILVFVIQFLQKGKTTKESLSSALKFLAMDIPLFFALAGPILAKRSLNLSLLGEDIRFIVSNYPIFGFLILLPLSTFVAIFALGLKFDQPYFDKLNTEPEIGIRAPVPNNWKLQIWNLSMRLMETLIAGIIVTICLGGVHLPLPKPVSYTYLSYGVNFIFKCVLVLILATIIKSLRPRMRITQTVNFSFKVLTPIALGSILLIGGYIGIWGIS